MPERSSESAGDAATGESSRNQRGGARGGRDRGRGGRGSKDGGRGDWRSQKGGKRSKNDDWREWKRRKVDSVEGARANPFSKEEIDAEERRPKRKVAVMIGYAGTGYKGMQLNGEEETIERDLFRAFVAAGAISKANADDPRKSSLARCARTDKGVHAAGNVISLKLIIEDEDIVERINGALPPQIRVWGIQRTNNSYNCYQYCDSRWYEYLMPSYCLLPPHPQSYLGHRVAEINRERGAEDEARARLADVEGFWEQVEERDIRPILDRLDPEVRAAVLANAHSEETSAGEVKETGKEDGEEESPKKDGEVESGDTEAGEAKPEDASKEDAAAAEKPKRRELGPVDIALKGIKAAYVAAKRRYRVTPERLQRLQDALRRYEGTNNFHNYTVQKSFSDPSSKRHIKSFVVNPRAVIIGDTEWISLKVHGQSFMMHQIRKMVGLATLVARCGTAVERIDESYGRAKMAIPKMPGLGLLLERPVFENYNRRAREALQREEIDFDRYEQRLDEFKEREIYSRIFSVEEKENSFHAFFSQIDHFRSNHFLWLSAGGMSVASIANAGNKSASDIDKALGDEDEEDPEGGEG
ncbi:tRNA pseudouridine synthase 1 [Escovopsis weberi]|uniref:tRNA pseudouridine synthase 1 n=1 Tax=Escovopsis weberi TaxID=150374 RepID=A0A0M8N3D8_ESCWE|nr:tRNA pseudouridine synthase 1 [Escovopsis weberi]